MSAINVGGTQSYGMGINDSGQATGFRYNGTWEAFVWANGSKQVLPKLTGATHMIPRAINNSGVVVGSIDLPTGRVGFIWDAVNGTQTISEMETAGWTAYEFYGIGNTSDTGHTYICGYGTDPNDQKASFLLFKSLACGDWGYHAGDLNEDCYVDFLDFATFAADWLECTDPNDPNCGLAL